MAETWRRMLVLSEASWSAVRVTGIGNEFMLFGRDVDAVHVGRNEVRINGLSAAKVEKSLIPGQAAGCRKGRRTYLDQRRDAFDRPIGSQVEFEEFLHRFVPVAVVKLKIGTNPEIKIPGVHVTGAIPGQTMTDECTNKHHPFLDRLGEADIGLEIPAGILLFGCELARHEAISKTV